MKKQIVLFDVVILCVVALMPMLALGQSNDTTTIAKKLKIAIPARKFTEFVAIKRDPTTGENNYSGFAIEVFREVMNTTLSTTPYEFVPFERPDGTMNGTFDDMLKAVYSKEYDGVVGEITILFYRTQWVDFTMPYLESPIGMMVSINKQPTSNNNDAGFSLIRITYVFVITTFALSFIAFFVAAINVGISIWARCFGENDNRRGGDATLRGVTYTRLMVTTFLLIIVILVASYIISQASSHTSQRGSGTVKNLAELIRKEANVGFREGAFIRDLLLQKGFSESKLISLKDEEEMVDKLSRGTSNGGVDAIVAQSPHLKLIQAKHCDNFTVVLTPSIHATGMGFAFQIGSPLGNDVSKGILKIADKGRLEQIQENTIGSLEVCQDNPNNNFDVTSTFLPPDHNWILIVGGILVGLLTIVSFIFLF